MSRIDADSHVDETEATWEYMEPGESRFKPVTRDPERPTDRDHRWMAEGTAHSHGRLRWVAMLPLLSMDHAVEELRWAKDHGACGVFKKGIECDGRRAGDPYFLPLYEEASRLDVPICIHTGTDGP